MWWRNVAFLPLAAIRGVARQRHPLTAPSPSPSPSFAPSGHAITTLGTVQPLCSQSTGGGGGRAPEPDAIVLQGLTFFARHGVLPAEEALGQKFTVDVTLYRCLEAAGRSDDVAETVDYGAVYAQVKGVVQGQKRYNLLESIAHDIAKGILGSFGDVDAVKVRVKKPHVALMGDLEYSAVQIHRARHD